MYPSDNAGGFASRNAVTPLPNPGEGGPVGGPNMPGNMLPEQGRPVGGEAGSLLPNLGEGGPVSDPNRPGNMLPGQNRPVAGGVGSLLPNPGEGGPVAPGTGSNIPIIPLPEIGTGGPVAPGRPTPTIPVRPQPNFPCYYCATGRNARVRFLNAAVGYNPFRVYINNRFIVNGLGYASLTPYGRVTGGFQTVTITGMNGYVYLQKSVPIRSDDVTTMAIINTPGGIDLLAVSDVPCARPASLSCFRVCNLASNTNPLDVILTDGRVVFSDVRFKEATPYRRARPGEYQFYLAETNLRPMPRFMDIETVSGDTAVFELPQALVSFYVDIGSNAIYTVYILSGSGTPDSIQTLVVVDR